MDILNPIALIILALATFRVSRLLTVDVIFDGMRNKIWEKRPPHTHKIGYLFTCVWCMSIWVASLITICYTIVPVATTIVCIPFALSAVAGLVANRLDH
jgi:hypothetical protein